AHLVATLQMAGIDVYRAAAEFDADGKKYAAGTFVIPMSQVFARYAKDILEKQTYPEVRRSPTSPPEAPYDVTAWSLGMLLGVDHVVVKKPLGDSLRIDKLTGAPKLEGHVTGNGPRFVFDYRGADAARAMNALLAHGARVTIEPARDKAPARIAVAGVARKAIEDVATELGFDVRSEAAAAASPATALRIRAPRIAMYQPWTGGNMDEGWTRWVLEQYGFKSVPLHNDEVRAGGLKDKYDVIILPDQNPQQIINGASGNGIRPEYRGGIGTQGVTTLKQFVDAGGTLVTLGAASGLA